MAGSIRDRVVWLEFTRQARIIKSNVAASFLTDFPIDSQRTVRASNVATIKYTVQIPTAAVMMTSSELMEVANQSPFFTLFPFHIVNTSSLSHTYTDHNLIAIFLLAVSNTR